MILHVANPIYDSVFKYIMSDERISKTILSALLKKEVVKVEMRPHEYVNTTRDTLSMFRIDFAATVRERDADSEAFKDRVVLIELQKTWLDTETLRFRQYLGAQYSNKMNIRTDSAKGFAYPMVAVYLLGHRVGDIKEPVVYVNHDVYDYNGQVVKDGKEEPFVESLTHNSIIVQIPLLRGHVNNRLEKVLSIFDQSKKDAEDKGNGYYNNLVSKIFGDSDTYMYGLYYGQFLKTQSSRFSDLMTVSEDKEFITYDPPMSGESEDRRDQYLDIILNVDKIGMLSSYIGKYYNDETQQYSYGTIQINYEYKGA